MRTLTYDVATSLDGYIAATGGDVSAFPHDGPHVEDYLDRLASYSTVVMGRTTYESGYAYGLEPGARAYPHMDHHIVSRSIALPPNADVEVIADDVLRRIAALKAAPGGSIYLCGGGQLAGALLHAGLIDRVVLKIAPVILGGGTPLFAGGGAPVALRQVEVRSYANGVTLMEAVPSG